MLTLFTRRELQRILTVWFALLVAVTTCLPLVYQFNHLEVFLMIVITGVASLILFTASLFSSRISAEKLFAAINIHLLVIMIAMAGDRLLQLPPV